MDKENQNNEEAKPEIVIDKGFQPDKVDQTSHPPKTTDLGYQPDTTQQPEGVNPPTIDDTIDSGKSD